MTKETTSERICTVALQLLDEFADPTEISMRRIAVKIGITPMALYKHFENRETLLEAAISSEYKRLGQYFERANKRAGKGLKGMLGYLEYAVDHPNLFRYLFAARRNNAYRYPEDLNSGRSPTLSILHDVVRTAMAQRRLREDDVFEVSLAIWAHAHGLVMLYLSGRIHLPQDDFAKLYVRSLDRLLHGLEAVQVQPPSESPVQATSG
ncbi:MAG: TetR/AcrR family transcriptional regulator [Janthinobacterium lividum]